MERLYGAFLDPRDPEHKATLGRAPSRFDRHSDKLSAQLTNLLAAEPEATPERRDQIILQALKQQRAAVYFFDATFSVPKSVSLLHASLQVRAQQAREAGHTAEAADWTARAQTVWDGILAANQAMLDYLQREAGYSRAGYHAKGSGRYVDAHEWVIASFAQHTSRDNDPQLHVHNAILNRVLREDPLAARTGDQKAWRTLDGTALYAAKPAAGAIAERALAEYLTEHLGVQTLARPDGNGWEIAGISEELRNQFSSRRQAITPRLQELIGEYERTARRRTRAPSGPWRNSSRSTRAPPRHTLRRPGTPCWRNGKRNRVTPKPTRSAPFPMPRWTAATQAPMRIRRRARSWISSWPPRSLMSSSPRRRSPATTSPA
jgi:conjugative relaxase-like TrwC/TraI family protein